MFTPVLYPSFNSCYAANLAQQLSYDDKTPTYSSRTSKHSDAGLSLRTANGNSSNNVERFMPPCSFVFDT